MNAAIRRARYRFRLYVAGDAQNSSLAIHNLTSLCRDQLADRCDIDVVDVFEEPERALVDKVFMTPTLVIVSPKTARRIIGTLDDPEPVLRAIGLEPWAA